MSIKVMSVVWDKASVSGSTLIVLLALADYSDDEGKNIYPSIPSVAKKARLSADQARRVVKTLIEKHKVVVLVEEGGFRNGRNRSNEYAIDLEVLAQMQVPTQVWSTGTRADASTPPCADASTPLAPMQADPSLIHHKEPSLSQDDVEEVKTEATVVDPWNYWRFNLGVKKLKPAIEEAIDHLVTQYGKETVCWAMRESVVKNTRSHLSLGFAEWFCKKRKEEEELATQRLLTIRTSEEGEVDSTLDDFLAQQRQELYQEMNSERPISE